MQTPTRRPPFTAPRAQSARTGARLGGGHALAKGKACGIQTGRRGEQISDRWRSEETPLARR